MTAPTRIEAGAVAASVVGATKVYGSGETSVRALDEVTLDVPTGVFTAIMGPSGSGKSTLLHCLAGLDTLSSGEAYVGDIELGSLSDKALTRLRRDHIGFVFQAYNLVPTLTSAENITLPLRLAGRRAETDWLDGIVDTLGIRDRLGHRPAELSGGQQQRVALARALVTRPALVVADEPTGNLDSLAGRAALDFLRAAVRELGQTVVMVTHDPAAAARADRVVFLVDGRVDETLYDPTADRVIDRLKVMEGAS
ncbi:MAG: ABC transporter ATP-binding protein [Actinomycetia bacterium]|nr:ABC transporter ATP-binding protein [Actinomycetes bacterium]